MKTGTKEKSMGDATTRENLKNMVIEGWVYFNPEKNNVTLMLEGNEDGNGYNYIRTYDKIAEAAADFYVYTHSRKIKNTRANDRQINIERLLLDDGLFSLEKLLSCNYREKDKMIEEFGNIFTEYRKEFLARKRKERTKWN